MAQTTKTPAPAPGPAPAPTGNGEKQTRQRTATVGKCVTLVFAGRQHVADLRKLADATPDKRDALNALADSVDAAYKKFMTDIKLTF